MKAKIIVMLSGGKDSQACLIHSVKKYGKKNVLAIFCDTGWEHDTTIQHVHNVWFQFHNGAISRENTTALLPNKQKWLSNRTRGF